MSDFSQGPGWWQASDGKWYPPQPSAPPPTMPPPPQMGPPMGGYPVAPPQQSGMSGCLKAFLIVLGIFLVLGVVAFIVFWAFLDRVADDVGGFAERQEQAFQEVSLEDCREEDGQMVAEVRIENESGGRSDYTVTVSFDDADGDQITTGVAFVNSLDDGQGTDEVITSFTEAQDGFTCEVADVFRISSSFSD